jgi:hypothetical protein
MNLGKEMVDEKRVQVEYVKEAGMIADGFSKPRSINLLRQ